MKYAPAAFLVFLVSSAYLAAFDTPSLFYVANVFFHLIAGLGFTVLGAWLLFRGRRNSWAAVFGLGSVGTALYLAVNGATSANRLVLYAHIAFSLSTVLALNWRFRLAGITLALAVLAVRQLPDPQARIRNSAFVPTSMEEEGDRGGPFWPSPARTNVGGVIPAQFFMESKQCGECHRDIYEQWNSSVHHFASFNNQFYRKSIEDMQAIQGSTQASKWCAGCHDHAVLFSGRWEKPIREQVYTPEAQTGLGCVSCHAISHVEGSVGNGGFTIEYPPLHQLATSKNPFVKAVDRYFTRLDPGPHRRTFLKPFIRNDSAEFCSACHKVHLDVPVNNYRWLRGFNDYDNWQASGVSGQGARSFYYPAQRSTCTDCHMPKVRSNDPGNRDGFVHNHRFPAANTAVPFVNGDRAQLEQTEKFLQSGFITIDLFAVSPVEDLRGQPEMRRRSLDHAPKLNSTMAVGEEGEAGGPVFLREVGKVAAPLDTANVRLEPGSTVRLDAVVRTRKIGHFFPGGTVDAFDIWVEVIGKDAGGRVFFWSGMVEDDGRGPVERGAHFYRSYMIDAEGNHVNKRNAWQARSVLYVRLIPPGAADTVHYRVRIPADVQGPLTFTAKLNLRKFSHYYTQHVYSRRPDVSGPIKDHTPDLPITVLAETSVTLGVGRTDWTPRVVKADRERWNDWGIGMLLQGDLKGAEYAFQRVIEAEPEYADGWLNVARALIQEGETDAAKPYLARALALNPRLGRIHYFQALVHKADGDYDAALASLKIVLEQYPRDRVVLNQYGRIHFLRRDYHRAIEAFQRVLAIDTEDVQAHYNLMLAYRGRGDQAAAEREERLFRRFKADESSQELTAQVRRLSAEDNNERQAIHEHESVPPFLLPDHVRRRDGVRFSSRGSFSGRDAVGGN